MNAPPKQMTIEEFVAWEERQEQRFEFDGLEAQAMTSATVAHATIQGNLLGALYVRLKGSRCRVFGSLLKVRTERSVRYPDALIACAPADPGSTTAHAPKVIFEILGRSVAQRDPAARTAEYQTLPSLQRYAEYQSLPSLQRYVVLHVSHPAAEVFYRDGEGEWAYALVTAGGALDMPEVAVSAPLAEIYEGVEFAS